MEGYRCPKCGEETIPGDVVARTQKQARDLGLYGPQNLSRRRLVKNGNSLAVTLDAQMLEEVFGYRPEAGEEVTIGRQGHAIVVEPTGVEFANPTPQQVRDFVNKDKQQRAPGNDFAKHIKAPKK